MFGLAVIFLVVRLKTKEKRDFIISMGFVVLGSIITYLTLPGSILLFFLVAAVLSFLGDLLMAEWIKITEHRIVDGVMAFGLAHIIYMVGFNRLNIGWFDLGMDWWYTLLGVLVFVGGYKYIGYNEKLHYSLKIANFIYVALIVGLFVIVLGFVLFPTTPFLVRIVALFGIVSFMGSDSVLAFNEFQQPIPNAKDIIAVTYIIAQICLQLVPLLVFINP